MMPPLISGAYGYSIAIGLIGIMLAIGGIVLGIGFALNDKRLKEFGKNELTQSAINGVLVGSMMLLFANGGVMNTLINGVVGTNNTTIACPEALTQNSALCFGYNYLVGPLPFTYMGQEHYSILDKVTGIFIALMSFVGIVGFAAEFTLNVGLVSVNLSQALTPVLAISDSILKELGFILVSISVQQALLLFIAATALTVMLPLGLILRTFYPTRKLGGFFIALTVGLYVVLPLSYVLNAYVSTSILSNVNMTSVTLLSQAITNQSSILTTNATDKLSVANFEGIGSRMAQGFQTLVSDLFAFIGETIFTTLILPLFSLVITFLTIKELSAVLGSEVNIPGFRLV